MAEYGFSAQRPPSDAVAFKAQHLVNSKGAQPLGGRSYYVRGSSNPAILARDRNWYTVVITRNRGWGTARWELDGLCSCPATSGCSHLLAAGYFEHVNRKAKP